MTLKMSRIRVFAAIFLAGCAGAAGAQVSVGYTYDSLGRVTGVTAANGDTITYTYDAADNRTQKATTSISAAPTVSNVSATIPHNTATGVSLSVSGIYTATAAASGPSHGSVTFSGSTATYTPATGYSGSDSFTYTATGPGGTSSPATAILTVSPSAFTQTIQITGSGPVSLRDLADTAGYTGAQNATITFEVGSGVTIMGDPGGGIGIDSGTWPGAFTATLTLVVKAGGTVYGGGGNGGGGGVLLSDYGSDGAPGGDAIYARIPMSVTVQSGAVIAGGGAGGHGGPGNDWWDPYTYTDYYYGGGGGGGGFPNGAGGAGGSMNNLQYYSGHDGTSGQDGTLSGGGGGGAQLSFAPYNHNSDTSTAGGGAGGGNSIRKNGHIVSVSNSGTMVGPQS